MKMTHPVDNWRTKNVPDDAIEKHLEHGWTETPDDEPEAVVENAEPESAEPTSEAPEPTPAPKKRAAKKAAASFVEA